MRNVTRVLAVAAVLVAGFMIAGPSHAVGKTRAHHVVFHIDQNDKAVMNQLLNNVENVMQYYQDKGEKLDVEVVAYGPGLMMLRDDKSPVKGCLAALKKVAFPSNLTFSACHTTMTKMQKEEGHAIPIIPEARSCARRRRALD